MDEERINSKVFQWAREASELTRRSINWCSRFGKTLSELDCLQYFDLDIVRGSSYKVVKREFDSTLWDYCERNWQTDINRINAVRGQGRNKLRTYNQFKQKLETETYVRCGMPIAHKRSLCKFRTGVAPLAIETGRYTNTPVNQRKCFHCDYETEDEKHVLMDCSLYDDLRHELFEDSARVVPGFQDFNNVEKFNCLLSHPNTVYASAKTCFLILQRRNNFLYL
jgi:hypothetical protein